MKNTRLFTYIFILALFIASITTLASTEITELSNILMGNIENITGYDFPAQKIKRKAEKEITLKIEQNSSFNNTETWQMKVLNNNLDFTAEDFLSLSLEDQKIIYQTANNLCNVVFVEKIKQLNPTLEPINEPVLDGNIIIEPSITSQFMDIATIQNIIFQKLTTLRAKGLLFTQTEHSFDQNWHKKEVDSFGRILGSTYLQAIIDQYDLKHIKVPQKILVVDLEKNSKNQVTIKPLANRMTCITIPHSYIYAKTINGLKNPDGKRTFTRDEIKELFTILELSQYSDLNLENFIVTDQAIYFIDTEFIPGFNNALDWAKLSRFLGYIASADKKYFSALLSQKLNEKNTLPVTYENAQMYYNYKKNDPNKSTDDFFNNSALFMKYCELVGSNHPRTIDNFPFQKLLDLPIGNLSILNLENIETENINKKLPIKKNNWYKYLFGGLALSGIVGFIVYYFKFRKK